ncbi:ATP/GTP-binding protein [Streptomyces sp. NPDC046977]|uniref:GTP-binding protein n=1 Tax=Streptomyces sp. NPDC046977 TaxID=3154703 RepID=UPI003407B3B0
MADLKIVIAGGFGVGKTTLVGAISEISPLTTEEVLTTASKDTDSLEGIGDKTTTTVAMDFGRITFDQPRPMVLFLFGTPGQERFWFIWDDLCLGAVGAVVLVDTRHLEKSFAAVTYFEERGIPFVVAVNRFSDGYHYTDEEVRSALELSPSVPYLTCDARDRYSALTVIVALVEHSLANAASRSLTSHGAHT